MNSEDLRDLMVINVNNVVDQLILDMEEFEDTMRLSGASDKAIKDGLKEDRKTRGRIFGAFVNKTNRKITNGIESASNISALETMEEAGVQQYMWVSTGKNVCPDCEDRAGLQGDIVLFESIGMPKSGFSVCNEHCQCQVVPVEYTEEGEKFIKVKK